MRLKKKKHAVERRHSLQTIIPFEIEGPICLPAKHKTDAKMKKIGGILQRKCFEEMERDSSNYREIWTEKVHSSNSSLHSINSHYPNRRVGFPSHRRLH